MGNNVLFRLWRDHSMRDFHVTLGVISVVSQVIGNISKNPNMYVIGDVVALIGIFHFFIHSYFHRQQQFVTDNQRVYSLPKKKIGKTGSLYLLAFVISVGVGMAVARELYVGTLFAKIKAMFVYLFGAALSAVLGTEGLGKDELMVQNNTNLMGVMNQISGKEKSPWENLINSIQTVLIIVGIVLLVVLCIAVLVNYVRRLIKGSQLQVKNQREHVVADREEALGRKEGGRRKILDFSSNAKARRIYRNSINRRRRRGQVVSDWMTPSEIEAMVAFSGEEKYQELHEIYEKARYSEDGCSEADVKRAKSLKV